MISVIPLVFFWGMCLGAEEYEYIPSPNATRSTLAGVQAYRSALTLDWLAAEDQRQRDLAAAYVTQIPSPSRSISTECIGYPRPSSGKVARLMLELLKNLEGDDSMVVSEMIQALMRSKMLVETSPLEAEPDLDSLVKTPGVMMGEPHITFPRILAMTWMTVSDPVTTKKFGWCPLQKLNKYLATTKPANIAKHMRALEPIIARARYIMEEFIQHVTPLNIYEKKSSSPVPKLQTSTKFQPEDAVMAGQEMEKAIDAASADQVPSHSRTFRRLVISTRAIRSSTASVPDVSPQVEISRADSTPNRVEPESLSNVMGPKAAKCDKSSVSMPLLLFLITFDLFIV